MLKSATFAFTITLALSVSALPALSLDREGGNRGGGEHHQGGGEHEGGGRGGPTGRGTSGAVPGPVEGVGLPFLLAGGALAAAMISRKRSNGGAASGEQAS